MNPSEIKFPNFYLLIKNHKDVLKENQGLLFPSVEFYYDALQNAISFEISTISERSIMNYWLKKFQDLFEIYFDEDDLSYYDVLSLYPTTHNIRAFIIFIKREVVKNDITIGSYTFDEFIKEKIHKLFEEIPYEHKLGNDPLLNDWERHKAIILEFYRKRSIEEIIKKIEELKDSGEIDERESLKQSQQFLYKDSLAFIQLQGNKKTDEKKIMSATNFLLIVYLSLRSKGEQINFNSEVDKTNFKEIVRDLEKGQGEFWDDLEALFRKFKVDTIVEATIKKYVNFKTLFNLLNQEGTSTDPNEYKRKFNNKVKTLRGIIKSTEFNVYFTKALNEELDKMYEQRNEYFLTNPSLPSI